MINPIRETQELFECGSRMSVQGTCTKEPWTKTMVGVRIECERYGVGRAEKSNEGEMGTTVTEQQ